MKTVTEYMGKKKFRTIIRGHEVVTDVPEKTGGEDTAPTPVEIFIASLGSCAGVFASWYLETAKINVEKMFIDVDWDYASDPRRVGRADITVRLPGVELAERERGLIAAVKKCTVHNTLENPPEVSIKIAVDQPE
ncbi:MAG: OsmC family protein [Candidatus Omnitrophota bacterium]